MTKDGPIWLALLSVGTGAALGAVCRWMLSYALNPMTSWMPMGTLVANALGGFLIGLVLAWTAATPDIPPAVRLFIVTGFLGGLTTFSTFSAEAFTFIEAGRFLQAGCHIVTHVTCSLMGTLLGWRWMKALLT